ncbi:MAG: hypothetical protein ABIZ70_15515 [Gemmatimonadales bacterium]
MRAARLLVFATLTLAAPVSLLSQTTADTVAACPTNLSVKAGKVCAAALDGVTMLHPLAALLVSGGNPVIGTAGAAAGGRFGHFYFSLRANSVQAIIPDLAYDGTADTVGMHRRVRLYAPRADLSAGLLKKKMPMGTVAADFILSALLIPADASESFTPVPGSRTLAGYTVQLDWGLRLAMAGPKLPLVSLTAMKRGTPTVTVGKVTEGDLAAYTFDASAINVRLMLGKRFRWIEFAGGGGADLLGGKAVVFYRDPANGALQSAIEKKFSGMRLTAAANLALLIGRMRIGAEGGYQAGKSDSLTTVFAQNNTSAGKFYGGLGVGVSF